MRDNRQDILENLFIDKQWTQMETLLDSKLPVTTPSVQPVSTHSHTAGFYILLSLLTFSVATAVYYAYKYETLVPTAQITKEKTIYKTIYITEPRAEATSPIAQTAVSIYKAKETSQVEASLTTHSMAATINTSIASPKTTVDPPQEAKSSNPLHSSLEAINTKTSTLAKEEQKLKLFSEEAALLENEAVNKSIRYNVGVQTLVTTDLDFTGVGIESGMVIPLSEKVGLNTGFALNYLTRDEYFTQPFDRDPQESTSIGEYSVRSLKQVYIPLGIHYAFTNNFALNSGVRVRYTYNEDLQSQLGSKFKGLTISGPFSESNGILDNTNIGLTAGFLYKLNGHFSILLDSEWGFSTLIGNSQLTTPTSVRYDRNLVNLTTNYTF